jgi:transcriptional regulator with XRE-family HTH domain
MAMRIDSLEQLGFILRETRVAQKVPLQDLAEGLNTSHTLLRRQEHGQPTKALEILFATMQELGIELHVELPPNVQIDENKLLSGLKHSRARP